MDKRVVFMLLSEVETLHEVINRVLQESASYIGSCCPIIPICPVLGIKLNSYCKVSHSLFPFSYCIMSSTSSEVVWCIEWTIHNAHGICIDSFFCLSCKVKSCTHDIPCIWVCFIFIKKCLGFLYCWAHH